MYLRTWAGKKSAREIAGDLHRSKRAVECQMSSLMISYRHHESKLVWCENCCAWRTRITDGFCPVCSRKRTREAQKATEARLMRRLTPGEAAMKRPQLHQSLIDPKPRPSSISGLTDYYAAKVADRDAVAMQEWEVRQLDRENAARRRRIERLKNQLKSKKFSD